MYWCELLQAHRTVADRLGKPGRNLTAIATGVSLLYARRQRSRLARRGTCNERLDSLCDGGDPEANGIEKIRRHSGLSALQKVR